MILQLDPTVLMDTPIRIGHAPFIIDCGMRQNTYWMVAVQEISIIKHFDCADVILNMNHTYGMNALHNGFKHPEPKTNNDTSQVEMVKQGNN